MLAPKPPVRELGRPREVPVKTAAAEAPRSRHPAPSTFPEPPLLLLDRKGGAQFTRGGLLGEGGFARCYEATDPQGGRFAVKVICKASLKSAKQKQKLIAEIRIHQLMSHPHIVGFKQVFEDDDFVYMILELCDNKTFVEMLKTRKRLTEPEVRHYMWQLLDAVSEVHRRGVIHRDLKLGNFFLTKDMKLKLGDFGLAATIKHDGERKKTICGTPNYIAPEVLFDTQTGHSYEVDIWSLGVVMYTFLVGRPPFQTKDVKAIYKKIRDNNYDFPPQIKMSSAARGMIEALLQSRPECRPSVDDVMHHEFFAIHPTTRVMPVSALTSIPEFALSSSVSSSSASSSSTPSSAQQPPLVEAFSAPADNRSVPPPIPPPPGKSTNRLPSTRQPAVPSQSPKKERAPLTSNIPLVNEFARMKIETENRPPIPSSWMRRQQAADASRASTKSNGSAGRPQAYLPTPDPDSDAENASGSARSNSPAINGRKSRETLTRTPLSPRNGDSAANAQRIPTPEKTRTSPRPVTASVQSSPATSCQSPRRSVSVLTEMYRNLQEALSEGNLAPPPPDHADIAPPRIFITKWIDYSNKYGLGYQLRDGSVGVYFNDSTSLILAADNHHFEYLFYDKGSDRLSLQRRAFTMTDYTPDLKKKVTLLEHFRSYMQDNLYKACQNTPQTSPNTENLDFLTKYVRTKHGVIFRLSNRIVQLNLFDHSKIILSNEGLVVTFIDVNRQFTTKSLAAFARSGDKDITERLRYMREVLHQMILKKQRRAEENSGVRRAS
ncbi:hypothetical protein PhCBS80983_g05725 [Powellomyces hirtus]|uniref:Serine/threonine-protein kinase n=1 Tax=Powellomyces hirtus TaxID=109895 RepID=A0A507DU67_9FUNG|nr:hypothetical protein PhCBS80983_g05725 [Powellomyces hirtus]